MKEITTTYVDAVNSAIDELEQQADNLDDILAELDNFPAGDPVPKLAAEIHNLRQITNELRAEHNTFVLARAGLPTTR